MELRRSNKSLLGEAIYGGAEAFQRCDVKWLTNVVRALSIAVSCAVNC